MIESSFEEKEDEVVSRNGESSVSVPLDAADSLEVDVYVAQPVYIDLPIEDSGIDMAITDEGTIVYDSGDAVDFGVQVENPTPEVQALRILSVINNSLASKEISYEYDIPDGYQMVTFDEYLEKYASEQEKNNPSDYALFKGEVYILDEDKCIFMYIDPAWAEDAEGNSIETYYTVNGNTLTQHVLFDENDKFPIVADPKNNTVYKQEYYLTKDGVEEMEYKYTGSTCAYASSGMVTLGISTVKKVGAAAKFIPYVSGAWSLICFENTYLSMKKKDTWHKIYKNFPKKKKYVKIYAQYKYVQNVRHYLPTGKLQTQYVTAITGGGGRSF